MYISHILLRFSNRHIYIFITTGWRRLIIATGWRRLIGSPKLQIILHKRATKCRSLLREMTYKDKGSYESLPPCSMRSTRFVYTLEFKYPAKLVLDVQIPTRVQGEKKDS